jgi:hypothetical protein
MEDCPLGLECLGGVCTASCTPAKTCDANPMLHLSFYCDLPSQVCLPAKEAGVAAAADEQCLSHTRSIGGRCVSPLTWTCGSRSEATDALNQVAADAQCASGFCTANRCSVSH